MTTPGMKFTPIAHVAAAAVASALIAAGCASEEPTIPDAATTASAATPTTTAKPFEVPDADLSFDLAQPDTSATVEEPNAPEGDASEHIDGVFPDPGGIDGVVCVDDGTQTTCVPEPEDGAEVEIPELEPHDHSEEPEPAAPTTTTTEATTTTVAEEPPTPTSAVDTTTTTTTTTVAEETPTSTTAADTTTSTTTTSTTTSTTTVATTTTTVPLPEQSGTTVNLVEDVGVDFTDLTGTETCTGPRPETGSEYCRRTSVPVALQIGDTLIFPGWEDYPGIVTEFRERGTWQGWLNHHLTTFEVVDLLICIVGPDARGVFAHTAYRDPDGNYRIVTNNNNGAGRC